MKVLIINPFGIGDVLFTTPVIRAVKEYDPHAFVGYWCNERVKPSWKPTEDGKLYPLPMRY